MSGQAQFGGNAVRPVPARVAVYQELFDTYVVRDASTGCHCWAGRTDRDGQPRFKMAQVIYSARRVALAWALDQDLTGVEVVHVTCGTKSCVNPEHLRALRRVMLPPTSTVEDRQRSRVGQVQP